MHRVDPTTSSRLITDEQTQLVIPLREAMLRLVEAGLGRRKPLIFATCPVHLELGTTTSIPERIDQLITFALQQARNDERTGLIQKRAMGHSHAKQPCPDEHSRNEPPSTATLTRLADIDAVTNPIRATQLEIQWFRDRQLAYAGGGDRTTMQYIEHLEDRLAQLPQATTTSRTQRRPSQSPRTSRRSTISSP